MSSERDQLLHAVRMALRAFITAAEALEDAAGEQLGLNRTDHRCVDILERHAPMAAGDLAREAGLSTGAMTTVLDRLERIGYARRVVDPTDRRRVLIELTPDVIRRADSIYRPLIARGTETLARFDTQQLETIRSFLEGGAKITSDYVAELRTTSNEPGARPPDAVSDS